ncbi:MAG: cysteine--tRNA ligase [Candidatus Borkfalkiaceae bacterium]|nr:cysteine--tRNA ligase [Clostridia bacterium]MDY6224123.1 cysteine--tRNA ligase [Christensenellaceae bacterium]
MKIYNSLTRQKEEFVPIEEGKVKMYACGITVSGEAHVGHAYQALIYDIMRKYFQKKGYSVTYARNYTDVDDKIIAKSRETGISADVYAAEMIKNIDGVMRRFRVDDPDLWLKATENIGNIIDFIQGLIEKGHAYSTGDGNVYFDVDTYPAYGHLSGRNLQDALDGVRVENDENKKHAYDFALWKAAKEGEICWDSPWGKGRPGWHIECSAMNRAAFGDQIDLHGGGRDLIFPHHENEIAQTEALTGKRFVKYWTHNGLIKVNGQKMSKSLGNSLLLSDLLDKYSDEAIKFALLQTNYRGDINVTDDLFPEAEKHIREFYLTLSEAEKARRGGLIPDRADETFAKKADEAFDKAMDDDFNTALALSDLFGLFKEVRAYLAQNDAKGVALADQIKKTYALLGLFKKTPEEYLTRYNKTHEENISAEAIALAEERKAARANKDWKKSDELRARLTAMGYAVKDTKDGYELQKA